MSDVLDSPRLKKAARAAAEIIAAHREGRPLKVDTVEQAAWADGLIHTLHQGKIDAGANAAQQIRDAYPDMWLPRNWCLMFDKMPPLGGQSPFLPDDGRPFRIARRKGADTTLIILTAEGLGGTGVPFPLLHRWLGLLNANIIYPSKPLQTSYMSDLDALAADFEGAVEQLRRAVEELRTRRLFVCGQSSAAYAAMRIGVELGAQGAIGLGAITSLTEEAELSPDTVKRRDPNSPIGEDLRPLLSSADPVMRLLLVYGEACWDDRVRADFLRDVPGYGEYVIAGFTAHNVTLGMILRDLYLPVIEPFLFPPGLGG